MNASVHLEPKKWRISVSPVVTKDSRSVCLTFEEYANGPHVYIFFAEEDRPNLLKVLGRLLRQVRGEQIGN